MRSTKEIYDRLRDCYTSSQSTNTDKAKRFRSIYEDFARMENVDFDAPNITLGERLSQIFQVRNLSYKTTEISKKLLWKLNDAVHKDTFVGDEELQEYYQALLSIIRLVTNEEPDERSLILSGIQKEWYVEGLNPEQKAAVIDDSQIIVVNAGPGTGKTHLLVHKMLYYLKDNPQRNLVALSFTNAAASQLRTRFINVLTSVGKQAEEYSGSRTATIHSYCYQCLADYYNSLGKSFNYVILDSSDIPAVAEDIALSCGRMEAKNMIIDILENGGKGELAQYVEKYKRQHNFIRVEDILYLFIEEYEYEEFQNWLSGRMDCLLIDESQDLTATIYKIVRIFIEVNPQLNLFFVGDPRQNIFSFNGGSYRNLTTFLKDKNASEHTLTITYRCPQAIINLVNPLEFSDCANPQLVLADKALMGNYVELPCPTRYSEATSIVEIVKSINDLTNTCVMASGLWYLEETAKQLNEANIPFEIRGGKRFLAHPIKMINYCLRFATNNDEYSPSQLRHYIRNFYDSNLFKSLQKYYQEKSALQNTSLLELIDEISVILDEERFIEVEQMKLVKRYFEIATEFKTVNDLLFACSSGKNDKFSEFYERDFNVLCTCDNLEETRSLVLTTIHAAKGLEWDNVILAGAADRILPSYKCYDSSLSIEQSQERLNEEKKKYYVAVTRSKKNLFISYSTTSQNQWGRVFQCVKSPFICNAT